LLELNASQSKIILFEPANAERATPPEPKAVQENLLDMERVLGDYESDRRGGREAARRQAIAIPRSRRRTLPGMAHA